MVHRDHADDKVHDQQDDEGDSARNSIPFGLKGRSKKAIRIKVLATIVTHTLYTHFGHPVSGGQ